MELTSQMQYTCEGPLVITHKIGNFGKMARIERLLDNVLHNWTTKG